MRPERPKEGESSGDILFLFYLLIFIPSLILFLLGQIDSSLYSLLNTQFKASPSAPWGIVTANFVHRDLQQFALDMGLFAMFLWGFAVVDGVCGGPESRHHELVLSVSSFTSAILAITFLILLGGSGVGASGIVYATAGFTLGFALPNRVCILGRTREWKMLPRRDSLNWYIFLFGLVVGPIAATIGGGNVIVHLTAYSLGGVVGARVGAESNQRERGRGKG